MNAPIKWNSYNSKEVRTLARPRWRELRQSFLVAQSGFVLLLVVALPGLLLTGSLGDRLGAWLRLETDDQAALSFLLGAVGALLGYGLVLGGQWRCLVFAPQKHGAKELQFAALLCSFTAPACFLVAHYLGGAATYKALAPGPDGLRDLDPLNPGCTLQIIGVALFLVSTLLFTAHARAVARNLNDDRRARSLALYFWFVAFLLGGTAGMFLQARKVSVRDAWTVLALGWVLCVAWHAMALRSMARGIATVLARQLSGTRLSLAAAGREKGQVALQAASRLDGGW
jgi:hypothetical protein